MAEKNGSNGWKTAFIALMAAFIALAAFTMANIISPHVALQNAIAEVSGMNQVQCEQIQTLKDGMKRIEDKLDKVLDK